MNRGALLLLASYGAPLVAAYAIFVALAHLLSTSAFAAFGVVNAVVAMLNAVIAGGTIQAVARQVARASSSVPAVRHRALGRQAVVSVVITAVLFFLVEPFAALLGDASLVAPLRVAAFVPGVYALTAVQQGALNGEGRFGAQGALNVLMSALRPACVIGAVAAGLGVDGAFGAVIVASVLTFAGSFFLFRRPEPAPTPVAVPADEGTRSGVAFSTVQLGLQLLLALDLLVLKTTLTGDDGVRFIALYVAAQTVARIPYGLLLGVPQIAFSRSARAGMSRDALANGAGATLALVVALLALTWAVAVPLAEPLLLVIYPESFRDAAPVLVLLLGSAGLLAIGDVAQTMVAGAFGPRTSVIVLAVAVVVEITAALTLTPTHGVFGGAYASLAGGGTLAVLAVVVLAVRVRPQVPWTLVIMGLMLSAGAFVCAYLVGERAPSPMVALAFAALLFTVPGAIFAYAASGELRSISSGVGASRSGSP